jgi:hypothetical protein
MPPARPAWAGKSLTPASVKIKSSIKPAAVINILGKMIMQKDTTDYAPFAPSSVPPFVPAQLVGAIVAVKIFGWLLESDAHVTI